MIESVDTKRQQSLSSQFKLGRKAKKPPDRIARGPSNMGYLALCLLVGCLMPGLTSGLTSCDPGYYLSGGNTLCSICEAGYYCTGGSSARQSCSSPTYSLAGQISCTSCPSGHTCSSTSSLPTVCPQGSKVSGNTCSACSGIEDCSDPASVVSCTSNTMQPESDNIGCSPCPAGYSCSSTTVTDCTATSGAVSGLGASTCASSSTGYFGPSPFFTSIQLCPADTFTFGYNNVVCEICPAGKVCTGTAGSSTQTNCNSPSQSALGDPDCQAEDAGYLSGSSSNSIDRAACNADEIIIAGSSACVQCPAMYSCDPIAQTQTSCGTGTYSTAGEMTCHSNPFGAAVNTGTGVTTTCSGNTFFNSATSTCDTCAADTICDPTTGAASVCQVGYYIEEANTPHDCQPCVAGRFCADGINYASVTGQKMSKALNPSEVDCFPGHSCSTTVETACGVGEWSARESNACQTTAEWLWEQDLTGQTCPAQSIQTTARLSCDMSALDYDSATATAATVACITADQALSWYGETCETQTDNVNNIFQYDSYGMDVYHDLKCEPGLSWNFETPGGCGAISETNKEFKEGEETNCNTGDLTGGSGVATSAQKHCADCPDLAACTTGVSTCWGQANTMANYNKVDFLQLHDRRLQDWEAGSCFDCNDYVHKDSICTFEANYFTGHAGHALTCPFQTDTRTVQRYDFPTTHSSTHTWYSTNSLTPTIGSTFEDERTRAGNNPSVSQPEYTSKVWFLDDESYEYPWCKTDYVYFDYTQLDDHNSTYDLGYTCPIYEHTTVNYKQCEPNYPGFISTTATDTPTNVEVGNDRKYYTVMEMDEMTENTQISLEQCPQHTSILSDAAGNEYTGGSNPTDACFLRRPADCQDTTSEYCNSGGEFSCERGFDFTLSESTFNDCAACPVGSYCAYGVAAATCSAGYQCPAYTDNEFTFPAAQGKIISSNVESSCTSGNYCPGATGTATACANGFDTDFGGTAETEHFSALACKPEDSGTGYNSGAGCTAGKYCPEASYTSTSQLNCPAGTLSAANAGDQDDCSDCGAGSWCAAGSSATSQCDAGSYCPDRVTIFKDEYGCPAGTSSAAGSGAETDCAACNAGEFCREGQTEAAMCDSANQVCPSGAALPVNCDAGKYISTANPSSAANCDNCVAGSHCSGFGGMQSCLKGYHAAATSENCLATDAGKFTATAGITTAAQTSAAAGKWSIAGDIEERDCPPGFTCDGAATKTQCTAGKYCPKGASSETSPTTTGMVMNEPELWYQKPCPAGKYCPASGTAAPAQVSTGYYTEQGELADSANACEDGYTCDSSTGSIGPWETGCALGEWSLSSASAAGCSTADCEAGKYCGQGRKYDCPVGFFCESGTAVQQECPAGSYRATVGGVSSADTECLPCTAGSACIGKGLTAVSAQCGAGYFCITKATSTTPNIDCTGFKSSTTNGGGDPTCVDSVTSVDTAVQQGICPQGFYCPQGVAEPTACAAGQFSTSSGSRDDALCIDCTEGFYCQDAFARVACPSGYFCPAVTSDYTSNVALAGQYSQLGYVTAVDCLPGTQQAATTQAACDQCQQGKYCDVKKLADGITCISGHDCNDLGTIYPKKCEFGYYAATPYGLCTVCPIDQYCGDHGLTAGTDCPNGYECLTNTPTQYPNWIPSENANYRLCDLGYYCDNAQTTTKQACAEGTYMPRYGAEVIGDCVPCPSGFMCELDTNLVSITPAVCTDGYYCAEGTGGSTFTTAPVQCTAGYKCPTNQRITADLVGTSSTAYPNQKGIDTMVKCEYGYYQDGTGQNVCKDCEAGKKCNAYAMSAMVDCDPGLYCDLNAAIGRLCDEGYLTPYSPQVQTTQDAKTDCVISAVTSWSKTYTLQGTIDNGYKSTAGGEVWGIPVIAGIICERGQYCVGGVTNSCVAGHYCENYGLSVDDKECDAGYYCLGAAVNRRPSSDTDELGNRCAVPATGVDVVGSYCVANSAAAVNCPTGTYSSSYGLTAVLECLTCPSGFKCDKAGGGMNYADLSLTTYICTEGYFCGAHIDGTTKTISNCTPGHKCPAGSLEAVNCKEGTYQDDTNALVCKDCTQGNYCPKVYNLASHSVTTSQLTPCPAGHECTTGLLKNPVPCAAGTFKAASDVLFQTCDQCTAGKYCPDLGTITPIDCPLYMVCPAGSSQPTACVDGYICDKTYVSTSTAAANDNNALSPLSQESDVECPAGHFCIQGRPQICYAGYICKTKSTTPIPTDSVQGSICPQGYYCLAGDYLATGPAVGEPCPIGQYSDKQGLESLAQCSACPTGKTCLTLPTIYPASSSCAGAFQCDTLGVATDTTAGYYSPAGISVQLVCTPGTFTDSGAAGCVANDPTNGCGYSSCTTCAAGYYCLPVSTTQGAIAQVACPEGFYCPLGSSNPQRYPCDAGTYGSVVAVGAQGLEQASECTSCPVNKYCPKKGMTTADATGTDYLCKAGYVCAAGSRTDTGSSECPIHHYCTEGAAAVACEAGTFTLQTGIASALECIECPPGKYCPTYGTAFTVYDCPAGHFCPGKIITDPSTGPTAALQCTQGHYCPAGTADPIQCEPGTFQNTVGQTTCTACVAGEYQNQSGQTSCEVCNTKESAVGVKLEWYCPLGSVQPQKCPIGTYVSADAQSCVSCPSGKYCWPCHFGTYCFSDTNAITYVATASHNGEVADCDPVDAVLTTARGFVCQGGAHSPYPTYSGYDLIQPNSVAFSSYSGPAIRGYYPAADKATLTGCIAGKYKTQFYGLECTDCMSGRECSDTAISDVHTRLCKEGYDCSDIVGAITEFGTTATNSTAATCNKGKFCSGNLIHSQDCPDGFFSNQTTLAICTTCPAGYFCNKDNTDPTIPETCIPDSVCDLGMKRQPICPSGRYVVYSDPLTKLIPSSCNVCPETYFCRAGIQADQCVAGYLCDEGLNTVPNPSIGQCPVGHYCPKGSTNEVRCPFKTMSIQTAQRQITDCRGCQPGYVCKWGDYDYYPCPKGHWCPVMGNSQYYKQEENECPPGTYSSWDKRVYQNECTLCPEGYDCGDYAITNLTSRECPRGHWCPQATVSPSKCPPGTYYNETAATSETDCLTCPAGSYCVEGSSVPVSCTNGHYCLAGASAQITCEGGNYCDESSNYQQEACPINFYCERGSTRPAACLIEERLICSVKSMEVPVYCGPGFEVIDNSKYGSANGCRACRPGQYSGYSSRECEVCPAGYVCYGETNTNRPTIFDNHNGERCPKGHYCPEGTFKATECPPGSFNAEEGKEKVEDCQLCQPGTFQDLWGSIGCKVCGQFADSREGVAICDCIGANRAYSAEDATCRCKSGFDFLDESETSKGNVSDLTDCFPLVFDNCKFNSEGKTARQPDGTCVGKDECAEACSGEPGTRSQVLGVCSCENYINVDDICNQNCRKTAPTVKFLSSTSIKIINSDGSEDTQDLTDVGNSYGALDECRTESQNCEIKSVDIKGDGFEGTYDLPESIKKALLRRRSLGHDISDTLIDHIERRQLQTAGSTNAKIFNPIYCIKEGDSFMFSIETPDHFPQYMKNSIMNTNDVFDYGAFTVLEEEMLRQKADNDETPSVFSFTFSQEGSYVFTDAANDQKILIVQVVGPGTECSDSDRFVQTITEQTLAEQGVSQSGKLILEPNYALIGAMGGLLIVATILILVSVGFCLHKGWNVKDLTQGTYRDYQLPMNIHHESEELFYAKNDFINFKSDLIDSEEDDLDNFNLDIQFDLIDAGETYLGTYNRRKNKHKRSKVQKRQDLSLLLKDIENLIQQLGNNAMGANMHWLDLDAQGEDVDEDKLREQIENELHQMEDREKEEDEAYNNKKEAMLKDASDRDKLIFKEAFQKLNQGQSQFNKEMQHDQIMDSQRSMVVEKKHALYDNGDLNSRNNKFVAQIQNNSNLNDEEKERLLKNHDEGLNQLNSIMDMDKKRQEQELDRILKERLERRRKLKEKQHAKEIKSEGLDAEKEVGAEYDQLAADFVVQNKAEQQEKINEVLKNPDYTEQRQGIKAVEKESEEAKKAGLEKLNEEKKARIQAKKDEIHAKYCAGAADEAEMRSELMDLMQNASGTYDQLLQAADDDKTKANDVIQERLRRRRELNEKKLRDKQAEFEDEIANMDIEQIVEQEKAADQAEAAMDEEKLEKAANSTNQTGLLSGAFGATGANPNVHSLIGNAMGAVTGLLDKEVNNYRETAKVEEETRHKETKKQLNDITDSIDVTMEKSSLMSQLQGLDSGLANLLDEDQKRQQEQILAKRALLLQRRKNKKKHELEEERVKDKVKLIEEEDVEKEKVSEEYIRKLFERKSGQVADTPEETERRLQLLNEFLSDQFLERMAGLLMKQFTEKEQMLKLLLQKYSDQQHAEQDAIKKQYKMDKDKLEELKDQMSEQSYNDTKKQLILSEENLLREVDLKLQNAHKIEEASMRKELEKKHAAEQVDYRQKMAQQQTKLRRQLVGDKALVDGEALADKQSLEKYERQKKQEQERRLRNIELQKKTMQNQYENEIKNSFTDYDDMLRHKKEQQKELDEDAAALRARIEERQEKIKNSNKDEGLTQEQQEHLLKNLQKQLESLDSAYSVEQQRQRLIMSQKVSQRKGKIEKARKLKDQLERQEALTSAKDMKKKLGSIFKRQGTIMLQETNDNSELMRRLRSWKIAQKKSTDETYNKKLVDTEVNLEESETKIMILKLLQTEKMLKEIRRQVRKIQATAQRPSKPLIRQSSRAPSVGSNRFRPESSVTGLNRNASRGESRLSNVRRQTSKNASRVSKRNLNRDSAENPVPTQGN